MFILYGIKNCDTVKQARQYLTELGCQFRFHDIRTDGLDENLVNTWATHVGFETLLNTRSKTWQKLSVSEKQNLNQAKAVHLICQYPTLMKRPVLLTGHDVIVGFKPAIYEELDHAYTNAD